MGCRRILRKESHMLDSQMGIPTTHNNKKGDNTMTNLKKEKKRLKKERDKLLAMKSPNYMLKRQAKTFFLMVVGLVVLVGVSYIIGSILEPPEADLPLALQWAVFLVGLLAWTSPL